jgi:hypothetical protein
MLTKEQVLEMIDRARFVCIGVKGSEKTAYFTIPHDTARRRAGMIAESGLLVEFGRPANQADTLYIESPL